MEDFITTDQGAFTFICPNVDVIFGYGPDEVHAMERISRLFGRDLIAPGQLEAGGEVRNIEHEIEAKHGVRRILLVHVKPVSIKGGTVLYVCRDITERRQAELELRELGGRLINAHEKERMRLSRELHDDIGQRVGLLSLDLSLLRQELAGAPEHVLQRVVTLSDKIKDVGSGLHRLSHELHPGRLEYLGLEASIRQFCDDVATAQQIPISVEFTDVPSVLEPDIVLCLYRIAQEALHNVAKHSGASRATVRVTGDGREIGLSVEDNGVGFNPDQTRSGAGIGLISMRERARIARGRMTLASRSGDGTKVDVRVPCIAASS
jgi:PAS domain S-box-containing protein